MNSNQQVIEYISTFIFWRKFEEGHFLQVCFFQVYFYECLVYVYVVKVLKYIYLIFVNMCP